MNFRDLPPNSLILISNYLSFPDFLVFCQAIGLHPSTLIRNRPINDIFYILKLPPSTFAQRLAINFISRPEFECKVKNCTCQNPTLLRFAVINNYIDLARFLIKSKTNIHIRDTDGFTHLHLSKSLEMINLLLTHGVDINARSNSLMTPLHSIILSTGNLEMVKALVRAGADVEARDWDGKSVTEYAIMTGLPDVATYLANVPWYKQTSQGFPE